MPINYFPEPKYFNVNFEPVIGESCSLVNTLLDCAAQITIGNYVSFGHDVMLLTAKHDYTKYLKERQDTSTAEPIVIEDGAWIGSRVIILGGVTIGSHAVIGANSVVTKNVPGKEMWFGSPAQFIKRL